MKPHGKEGAIDNPDGFYHFQLNFQIIPGGPKSTNGYGWLVLFIILQIADLCSKLSPSSNQLSL